MKRRLKNLRWNIADWLCRLANWLRGHESLWLGYDLYGNKSAALEEELRLTLVCARWSKLTKDELHNALVLLDELAQQARETWWHDRSK